jgi:gliding-associated putative ABC transporter substrate-binding component GldG
MKSKKAISYYILLIIGVIVLVNILSHRFFVRLDFTEDQRYTLSQATKDILENLDNPVTVTAYFSEDLPPHIAQTKTDFKDLLIEYSNRAGGNLVYEFINPNEDEEAQQKAVQAGIQPVLINVRDKDQMKQQKAFLGAVVQLGEESDVIPFMQPGAAMEYALSSSIKKLSVIDKPIIGLLQGHGEPSLRALQDVNNSLSVLYNVEEVRLTDTTDQLSKYETVAIIAPKDSFPDSHLAQLDNYLASGNDLLVAMNRVKGDFSTAMGSEVTTGLESWLSRKGLTVEKNFVVDQNCGNVSVPQRAGPFSIMAQIEFPYIPIISNFADHPATKGLEAVVLRFASSITFTGDTTLHYVPLVMTSEKSGTKSAPTYFNIQKKWSASDFPLSNLTVGALVEGKIAGDNNSRLIVISDGDFAVNGEGQDARQLQGDNVNLMVNCIDWLSDDTGLIDLRTKGVTARPLDEVEDSTKTLLKYLNFLLPIILIIIFGLIRSQRNRTLRIKRMEADYV